MVNDNCTPEISFIQKQFYCCVGLQQFTWQEIFENINIDTQEALIKNTVDSKLVLKCPIRINYQRAFIKCLISRLEKQGTEIADCVFNAYGRLVALHEDEFYFRHFLNNGCIISLKESRSFISEGTTGLYSWQASVALSEWCLVNKNIFEKKIVLELGSGTGLTGLTVGLCCLARKVYLTDNHPSVLGLLCDNVKFNVNRLNSTTRATLCNKTFRSDRHLLQETLNDHTSIEVLDLPWEEVPSEVLRVDIILAADVVYDPSLFMPLANAFQYLLVTGGSDRAVIACTERNELTLGQFLRILESFSLKFEELDVPPQMNYLWAVDSRIRIFAIYSS